LSTLEVIELEDLRLLRSAEEAFITNSGETYLPNLFELSFKEDLDPQSGFHILQHLLLHATASICIVIDLWPGDDISEVISTIVSLQFPTRVPEGMHYSFMTLTPVVEGRGSRSEGVISRFMANSLIEDVVDQPGLLDMGMFFDQPLLESIAHEFLSPFSENAFLPFISPTLMRSETHMPSPNSVFTATTASMA
jgi:hypothetical protein